MLAHPHSHPLALPWALALVPVGFVAGCVYFQALREGVARLLGGRPGTLTLLVARVAGMVLLMGAVAQCGAAALLCLFGGFLLARVRALQARPRVAAAPQGPA